MKKLLLLLLIVGSSTSISKAQMYIGIKGGANLAYMSDGKKPAEGTKEPLKIGGNGAFAFQYDMDRFFSMYAELGYSSKGKRVNDVEQKDMTITNYHYAQLAILPRFSYSSEIFRIYVNAGPTIGYLVGGRLKSKEYKANIEFVDSKDYFPQAKELLYLRDNTNRIEVSLTGGAGILLTAGPGEVMVDLRYDWGLTNVREDYHPDGEKAKNKNNVIGISVGYLYPLDLR